MGETVTRAQESAQWQTVFHIDDLWEGEMEAVDVNGTSIVLINLDGEVWAYKNRCPHQEWPLNDGDLDEKKLTCANHLWEFDVTTGKGINPANCALIGYQVRVDDDGGVQVRIP